MLPGFLSATKATRRAEVGSGSTPLIGASPIPTAAMAWSSPSSFSARSPPKECPTTIGLEASPGRPPDRRLGPGRGVRLGRVREGAGALAGGWLPQRDGAWLTAAAPTTDAQNGTY